MNSCTRGILFLTALVGFCLASTPSDIARADEQLSRICLSEDGTHFVSADSGDRFVVWGFNYDHDDGGRLLEDYWFDEWSTVTEDFQEMKVLGANVIRVHLQLSKFMRDANTPNEKALGQLARLVGLAERTGLYLDVTGLGCYQKKDVPRWYDSLAEQERWEVQCRFWAAVAKTCAQSNAIFCYDLMNEPILPGKGEKAAEWLAGEFAGKYFVQRITLNLGQRTREQVAEAWVSKLVAAVRKHDDHHLITVGVIPWVYPFPRAKPLFYSKEVGKYLDFVSVHFYPKKGKVDKALVALSAYQVGKPLVVEETFPLHCGMDQFSAFIDGSREKVDGYFGFYWGTTIEQYIEKKSDPVAGIVVDWLRYFRAKRPEILGLHAPAMHRNK